MVTTKKQYFYRLLTTTFLFALLTGCANYGMISENDVYLQKPTALSVGEDETDLTSYNAFKARERGDFQEAYLIDQMYSRTLIGTGLYGVRPMFGSPFMNRNFINWGYRSPILAYQNNFYYNGFNHWNRPWGFGNSFGFNGFGACGQGFFGYGYGYNPLFNNCNNFGHGIASNPPSFGQNTSNNNVNSNNHFSGRPRISLSSNSSRSSTYPNSLKSQELQPGSEVYINNEKLGTSRRAIQKKRVSGTHMPFKNGSNASISSFQRNKMSDAQQQNSRSQISARTNYMPSNSARRSGVARSPRATVNTTTRTGYSSSQNRRISNQSANSSRGTGFNTSRTTSSSVSRSSRGGSSTGSSSSSSGSSSSRRR